MPDLILSPVQPYSLSQSAWGSDPTRRFRDGVLEVAFAVDDQATLARVWQRPDGDLGVRLDRAADEHAVAHLRFLLAVDVDHAPFLAMATGDPLLRDVVSRRRGLRPVRVSTVAHALVQAVAGQLITAREARLIEHRIVALTSLRHGDLWLPPTCEGLRARSAAEFARTGLAPRRAAALARVVQTFDVERLRGVATDRAVARIERERTLGPWSAGVIAVHGLGRYEQGLVGDLGLIRLCGNLLGREATADDTQRLLARYGEWAGLAGVHLMRHPLAGQRLSRAA
jgi:3-methyladenine DNA glycosylase/8-oxoguanine DNA glycosylase